STVTGEGKPGLWRVIEDEVPSLIPSITADAPVPKKSVLAQLSRDPTDEHYPILVYTNETFGDFTFTTRLKCVAGAVEQMAGVVFRYQDERNYYYIRASAKGSTFRFFKLVNGERSPPIGPEIQIPAGVWHDLTVECKGNKIRTLFNGKPIIPELTDNSFAAGRIGFWTKSDSVSHFADARFTYTPREPFVKSLLRDIHRKYPRVLALRVYGKTAENPRVRVMASTDESELGQVGGSVEQQIFEMDVPFFGRIKNGVIVTLPVHDRNGDIIAALRVEMKSFPGQTENNALARALPIAKDMERRIVDAADLF
ncbi:MAG: family 16 glycoside hydrolase, partial [Limisphaerales bacterium]